MKMMERQKRAETKNFMLPICDFFPISFRSHFAMPEQYGGQVLEKATATQPSMSMFIAVSVTPVAPNFQQTIMTNCISPLHSLGSIWGPVVAVPPNNKEKRSRAMKVHEPSTSK
eukprot:EG_transcript_29619